MSFVWAIYPLLLLSRLCGIYPFSVHSASSRADVGDRTHARLSRIWLAYGLIIQGIVFALNMYTVPAYLEREFHQDKRYNNIISTVVTSSELLSVLLTSFAKAMLCLHYRESILQLIASFNALQGRNACMSFPRVRTFVTSQVLLMLAMLTAAYVYEYARSWLRKGSEPEITFPAMTIFVCHSINAVFYCTVDVGFICWMFLLEKRIRAVNLRLAAIEGAVMGGGVSRTEVLRLRMVHAAVLEDGLVLHASYCKQAMLTVTYAFFSVIFLMFYLAQYVLGTYQHLDALVGNMVWVGLLLTLLSQQCHRGARAVQQANRTPDLVHDLLNRDVGQLAREELKLFSMQLMHRKVNFTAGGVFAMDYSLLFKLVGGVTTYLVVLLQIQPQLQSNA